MLFILKLPNNVKLDVEIDNFVLTLPNVAQNNTDSTLFDVVNSNNDIHNIASMLT